MGTSVPAPSLDEVEEFVRRFSGIRKSTVITADTKIDSDLGITGDDGQELLEEAARHFDVRLVGQDGYRTTFGLAPNEYLFGGEGLDLLGIFNIANCAGGKPEPVVRDLTVGRLHEVICREKRAASSAA